MDNMKDKLMRPMTSSVANRQIKDCHKRDSLFYLYVS